MGRQRGQLRDSLFMFGMMALGTTGLGVGLALRAAGRLLPRNVSLGPLAVVDGMPDPEDLAIELARQKRIAAYDALGKLVHLYNTTLINPDRPLFATFAAGLQKAAQIERAKLVPAELFAAIEVPVADTIKPPPPPAEEATASNGTPMGATSQPIRDAFFEP